MNPPSLSRARLLRSAGFSANVGGVMIGPATVVVRDAAMARGIEERGGRVHASADEFLRLGHDYPADFAILE